MAVHEPDEEIDRLKRKLTEKTDEVRQLQSQLTKLTLEQSTVVTQTSTEPAKLDKESIGRYSRQLLLPEISVKGQLCLMKSKVLIVGAGGLGCPSAIYLAAAGVGCLGIIDYDEVELSNLHRQILHSEARVNMSKSASAALACNQLNSKVTCISYRIQLDSTNASEIIQLYDIVLDATDNVASRYLLNDACVLLGKPLVSGSALRFEGQLTVYNYQGGPCYRCLYATPPPPNMVTNCSDGGVIGAVPGVIGTLQALEAIKIITGITASYSHKLLLFDGLDGSFRTIKLRPRQSKCAVCGDSPTITQLIDYEQFCGSKANDKDRGLTILASTERISVQEYKQIVDKEQTHLLIDVRSPVELDICKLPYKAINIHPDKFALWKDETEQLLKPLIDELSKPCGDSLLPIFTLCRHGNDSQIAAKLLQEKLSHLPVIVKDIVGGLAAWAKHIDPEFPVY